jgi:hypothetical protein
MRLIALVFKKQFLNSVHSPLWGGPGWGKTVRVKAGWYYTFIILLIVLAPAQAALPTPTLPPPVFAITAEPSAIRVPRYDQAQYVTAKVIALATGAARLPPGAQLSFTASPGIEVQLLDREDKGGDVIWPLKLHAAADAPDESVVNFRLETPKGLEVQRAILKIHVTPALDASLADDAEISTEGDAADPATGVLVSAGITGNVMLSVRNKSADAFDVREITIDHPQFLSVKGGEGVFVVPAHEAVRVPIVIGVNGRAPAGTWQVHIAALLSRGVGASVQRASVAIAQKVSVGVPGVSDILKVLDVPSLLLIPGALVLGVWGLLRSGAKAAGTGWLDWKSASFWIVSITLSIGIFYVTSKATSTDFSFAYTLEDVAKLWIGCVAAALVSFLIVSLARAGYRYHLARSAARASEAAERERRAREPLQTDKPADILAKITKANLSFYLRTAVLTKDSATQDVFLLDFSAQADGCVWSVPPMLLKKLSDGKDQGDLMRKITNANNRPEDGRTDLINAVQAGLDKRWISFEWKVGAITRPEQVPNAQISNISGRDSPIQF